MTKLKDVFLIAALMVSVMLTGAFAAEPGDGPSKSEKDLEVTGEAPGSPEQRPMMSQGASRARTRRAQEEVIREFQQAVRDAQQKFRKAEKAASGLKGEERSAAMRKAAEKMKASIKKAEDEKDAALEKAGRGRKKPSRRRERIRQNIDTGQSSTEQENDEQGVGQMKDATKSPADQEKH